MRFSDGAVRTLVALVEERYPQEACGLCLSRPSEPDLILRVQPLANVHPNPSRAFAFDDGEHLLAQREAEAADEIIRAFFHSHPEGEARLSSTDLAGALIDDEPLWPGIDWIVVGTRGARVHGARRFRIDAAGPVEAPLRLTLR